MRRNSWVSNIKRKGGGQKSRNQGKRKGEEREKGTERTKGSTRQKDL